MFATDVNLLVKRPFLVPTSTAHRFTAYAWQTG
jgi:hypothetical protein